MGKMLIMLVIGMGLVGSYSMMQLNESNLNATDNASVDYEINQARNLALSGIDHAIMQLAQDSTWLDGFKSNSMANGSLAVNIERTRSMFPGGPDAGLNNARLVTATGTLQNRSVTLQAVIEIPSVYIRPPGLAYGILADKDFSVSGNVLVRDHYNSAWNSTIHTNSDLGWNGNTALVAGYGTYSGSGNGNASHAENIFKPNVDEGGGVVHYSPPVPIPDIDVDNWEKIATRKFYSNTKITSHTKLGTKDNPEIWYVRGDLELSGQMEGYGVFLVTGDLKLSGQAKMTALDPSGNNLGIIVAGDVRATGTSDLDATLIVGGTMTATGTTTIIGSVIAKGEIKFTGTPNIYYRPMLDALASKIWEDEPERPRIVSVYE
jgi:hypothetical protein